MDETTPAASSTVEVEDVFNGQQPSMAEYSRYRNEGELPERFKTPAEASDLAPDDALEKTDKTESEDSKPASDSEPDKQEPETKADKRIKQLLKERYELEQKLAAATKPGEKKESTPTAEQSLPQYAFPKPTEYDTNADGTPKYKDFADVVEAIGRWAAKEERMVWEREQAQQQAVKAVEAKLVDARARYDDADAVIFPTSQAIQDAKIPDAVKQVLYGSKVYIDLCYVLGGGDALQKLISLAQSDPREAVSQIFDYERDIKAELSVPRDDKGKFVGEKAPEPKKTSAPKPPSPVGGTSSKAFDVSDESLSADEWARKRRQQLQQKN